MSCSTIFNHLVLRREGRSNEVGTETMTIDKKRIVTRSRWVLAEGRRNVHGRNIGWNLCAHVRAKFG
jgi:hypothetical protein